MTRILILEIPAPTVRELRHGMPRMVPAWITSNQRLHPLVKARKTALWREAARDAVPEGTEPFTGRVRVMAHVWKPRGGRYDPLNWADTAKAAVDGLTDAGLWPDDDHEHLLGPDMRHGGYGAARLLLTIEEVR